VLSVVVATALFSLLLRRLGSVWIIFKIASVFALPVGVLFLPLVVALRNRGKWRSVLILLGGSLIGSLPLAIWALILLLSGSAHNAIWHNEPLTGLGLGPIMVFSALIGFIASCLYLLALKMYDGRA
jgi:hypothetical protein